jgi:hypothetical protein
MWTCSSEEDGPMTAPEINQAGMVDPGPASLPVSGVRASDADREHVIGVLREAFAEGRLTAEEHSTRVGQAYAARTYEELATVSADLPAGSSARRPAPWSSSPRTRVAPAAVRRTNSLAVAALVCSVIPGLPQLAAIGLGIGALRQIRRTSERGTALAAAGLVIATLGLLLTVLLVL